jgi:hypothetical protein
MQRPWQASIVTDFAAPAADPLVMRAIISMAAGWRGWLRSQALPLRAAQLASNGR